MQGKVEALNQERTDAKWWLGKEGEATLNGNRNRDVKRFWQHAEDSHQNVRGELREVRSLSDLAPC